MAAAGGEGFTRYVQWSRGYWRGCLVVATEVLPEGNAVALRPSLTQRVAGILDRILHTKLIGELGQFFGMSLDILIQTFHRPFAWREFLLQSWFVARVSMAPAIMVSTAFNILVIFTFNVLLSEIGAADLAGTGAALAVITQTGPISTVITIAGAGATAMCADLGSRTIREEIDAMRVMGINPIQRLAVPRVAALTLNALLLNALACSVAMCGDYLFSVYVSHVTPGAFVSSLTLLLGLSNSIFSFIKAMLFGLTAGLIACYKGFTAGGGPQGVGNAVNETVVYAFLALYFINSIVAAIEASVTR
jgi:phospholipid/cholesterol/gamma-HCH transport system permease protein